MTLFNKKRHDADLADTEPVNPSNLSKLHSNGTFFTNRNNAQYLNPYASPWWFDSFSKAQYENLLYYDPDIKWSKREERKLLTKLNLTVMLMVSLMFFGYQLCNVDLADAVRGGMAYDLSMESEQYTMGNSGTSSSGNDDIGRYYTGTSYGNALTVNKDVSNIQYAEKAGQIIMSIPSILVAKKIGPHIWLPALLSIYSALNVFCFAADQTSTLIGIRCAMGAVGAGFIPSCVLYLSYFYTSDQLAMRLTCLWVIRTIAEITSGYLAFAFARVEYSTASISNWELQLIVQGVVVCLGTIIIAFFLPISLTQRTKWQHGLLTERQKSIQVNILLKDDPSKGLSNNHSFMSLMELLKSIFDYDLFPVYVIGFLAFIPYGTYETYLLLCIRRFVAISDEIARYSFRMPWRILYMVLLVSITKISEKLNERTLVSLIFPLYQLPLLGVITWWSNTILYERESAIIVSLALAAPSIIAILQSWVSRNSGSNAKRAVSAAIFMMFFDAGQMVSIGIYKADYLPTLKKGNLSLFIIMIIVIVMLIITKIYYVSRNNALRTYWNKLDESEKIVYLENNGWNGNKTPYFQFSH